MTRFRWTIKRKLLTLGAGTFLVALTLLAFGLWSQIGERSRVELDRTSEEVATRISGTLDMVRSTLLTFAQVQGVQDLDREETERLIVDMLRVIPFLQGIAVIRADGRFLSTGSAGPPEEARTAEPPRTVADRAWFQQLIWSGEPVVSGLLKGRLTGQNVILVAVPIRKGTNHPHAVVGASLNLNRWFAFFSGLSLPPNMRIVVVDADGIVLSQNQGARSLVGQPIGAAFERPGLLEWEGHRLLMEAALVRGVSWRVLAMFPRTAIYARAWQEVKAVFLPMLVILGAAALFGLLIARRVWHPLQALTYGVREFGEGRALPVPVTSTDEVGELAQAFNEMTQQIHQSQASLERKARRLAAVVASSAAISGSLKLEEVLSKSLDVALQVMGMEAGAVRLLDEASGELVLAASHGALFRPADTPQRIKVGEGVSGYVAATKRPFFVPDTTREPRTALFVKMFGPGSAVSLPLLVQDRVVGTMSLFNRQPNDFDKEDAEILTAIGQQVGLAVETARLFQETERRARETAALGAAGTAMVSTLDLSVVLETITESAISLIGAQRCAVFELDPEDQLLRARTTRGVELKAVFTPQKLGQGAVGSAVLRREPVWSPDIEHQPLPMYDEMWQGTGMTLWEAVRQRGYRAILAVPMISRETVLGAICIYWNEVHVPEEREIRLLTALTQQAAVALDNARLYEAIRQQASRLRGLYEIGKTISSSLDLGRVLEQIADQAVEVIGSGRCAVWELDEAEQRLYVRATKGIAPDQFFSSVKVGQGGVGTAVATRTPVFTPDISTYPLPGFDEITKEHGVPLKEVLQKWGYRAMLAVPLIAREQPVGAISISWLEPHAIRQEEVETLMAFASQAALAMSNARLYEETVRDQAILEHSHRTLEAIHQLSVALQESGTLRERLNQILAGAQTLGVERLGIYLADPDGSHLRVTAGLDPGHPIGEISIPTTEEGGALAKVFREGCEVWLEPGQEVPADMRLGPRYRDIPFLRTKGFGLVPLKARGKVVGVMGVDNKTTARTIPRESVPLLRIFAQQAAVAIENARLVENLQSALDELKVTQEQLVRGETLRSLGEMAAGAAHHLNNLLAVVVARIQLLLRSLQDPKLRQPLQVVERAALDGAEVVRRIQQFARVRPQEEAAPVDLNRVAEEVLEFTRPRWQNESQARGVDIEARVIPGRIPTILGQAAEIREVVTNLVLNAVDALPRGGQIVLKSWAENGWVWLSVSDNGTGMSKEAKRQAFEPFFTTKGMKSTGLGLSVAYGIVQRHGGAIALESEEGRGTTVTLRFPALEPPISEEVAPTEPSTRSARLLAIDDEPVVLEAVKELLNSLGHAVTTAGSGAEGLALLEREQYDLVLTDLGMPGMTGWQVAQAVKSRWPKIPIVLVTGWADQIDLSDVPRVDRLLKKPFQIKDVQEAIAALLPE
jgi:GAF domain-containing protein/CheY-like chemotaxis protein/anti-sigma regulatory factor (Ser/Thr protein kinase)